MAQRIQPPRAVKKCRPKSKSGAENDENYANVASMCNARASDEANKYDLACAPATYKVSRPMRSHLCDVVSEVLEKVSTSNALHIEERKYDGDYDNHYAEAIISYMRSLEIRRRLPTDYLTNRSRSLNPKNRAIIVDWLIQVQHYLKLKQETLYLTIFIFDLFLLRADNVLVDRLQLVAITSILIASKMEERMVPECSALLRLTEHAYSVTQMRRMECLMLNTVKFQLVMPDPMVFLNRCIQVSRCSSEQVKHMSTLLMDTLLPDVSMCRKLLPSQMAAAAFCLARRLLLSHDEVTWDVLLEKHSGYKEQDLKETMVWMLCALAESASTKCVLTGVRKKYSSASTYQDLSSLPVLQAESIRKIIEVWK